MAKCKAVTRSAVKRLRVISVYSFILISSLSLLRVTAQIVTEVISARCVHRTNRCAIVMMSVHPSVCLSVCLGGRVL